MGLSYGMQSPLVLLGTITNENTLAATPVALTNSYAGNVGETDAGGYAEATLYIEYTPAVNGSSVQLEISTDPRAYDPLITPTYYQIVSTNVSSGVATIEPIEYDFTGPTAATTYYFRVLVPVADRAFRLRAKETTSGAAGSLVVKALFSGTGAS